MDELLDRAWRGYPAAVLVAVGLLLAASGVRRCLAAWRAGGGLMEPLTWMTGFRRTLLGLAVAGAGAAWEWQIGWLLAVSLVVGFEETLETSLCIAALRGQELRESASPNQRR